jgi:hypothetical protein
MYGSYVIRTVFGSVLPDKLKIYEATKNFRSHKFCCPLDYKNSFGSIISLGLFAADKKLFYAPIDY